MKLTLVIPIYNERIYLPEVFRRIREASYPGEITALEVIAVDDGSTDGSAEWLGALGSDMGCGLPTTLILQLNPTNEGKGRCVRQGIDLSKGDFVVIQDADLEYSPDDLEQLLEPLIAGRADAVFGSRFLGTPRRVIYFWHAAANQLLTRIFNLLFNTTLTDLTTGYKAFRGEMARNLDLRQKRFGIEVELAAAIAQSRLRLFETGISHHGRSYSEGKKFKRLDALAIALQILKFGILRPSPFKPGMRQTLTALYQASYLLYATPLKKLLLSLRGKSLGAGNQGLRVLEVGSGVGGVTQALLEASEVVASDIDEDSLELLRSRYSFHPGFQALKWDATLSPADGSTPRGIARGGFDLIVAFNVLEHIEHDAVVLKQWSSLLAPGGMMVLLVPFSQRLFSPVDQAVGHFRRYQKKDFEQLIQSCGGKVSRTIFLNPLGVLGWIWNAKILGRSVLPSGQVGLYSLLKPILEPLEALLARWFGLSIICAATWQKEEHSSLSS